MNKKRGALSGSRSISKRKDKKYRAKCGVEIEIPLRIEKTVLIFDLKSES